MCFVWLWEQTVTFAWYNINSLVFITVVESVYSAVRTESLYNTDSLVLHRFNIELVSAFCEDCRAATLFKQLVPSKLALQSHDIILYMN